MLDFLSRFFRKDDSSRSLAKERLRLVLMSDRVSLAPETFDAMKGEMLSVLQRYLEIDEHGLDVHFENAERHFMLLANIPVTQVKTRDQIAAEQSLLAVYGNGAHARTSAAETRTPPRRRRRRRRAAAANAAEQGAASNGAASNGAASNGEHQRNAAADDDISLESGAGEEATGDDATEGGGFRPDFDQQP
ncbi:MAG: cell division topological specificity factor MinE [Candidatus Eremiobacteraeota bacterium]|nr:cell division topological specificity factor MinE [Candidatus Eremiobacteraeota bacterium]